MAKKRPHDSHEEVHTEEVSGQAHETEAPFENSSTSTAEPGLPLMDEIQSFINLREELSRKLAAEIEAMEEKLAELKKTAASLFPQGDASEEKKGKKPKPKPSKEEKPRSEAPAEPAPSE